jgi:hypothetical protein
LQRQLLFIAKTFMRIDPCNEEKPEQGKRVKKKEEV